MAIFQEKSKRKASGGRYTSNNYKRNAQTGRTPAMTSINEKKVRVKRTIGGNSKAKLLSINKINILDPKTKKSVVADIKNVAESGANRHFIRRNIMTKGSVVETSKGKAKITNRPSQEGFVNGVLVK